MRWAATRVVAALLLGASPAQAGTIVFDFEDGLQGWELVGPVQRVQTQLLGGEWAIFGDGRLGESPVLPNIWLWDRDLRDLGIERADIERITFDVDLVEGPTGSAPTVFVFPPGVSPPVFFIWGSPDPLDPDTFTGVVAFIDNITIHTIPEPSVLGMLVMGGVAVLARRRAQGGRLS